jgi:cellulose synthase/poly-beta-1,6-N-acetylglucosamine synthase-like glycosyltransferase
MAEIIKTQRWPHYAYYAVFALISLALLWYYLSDTLWHYTTSQQFPISSFERMPLTWVIFPVEVFSILFGLYFVYTLFGSRVQNPPPQPLPNRSKTRVAILLPVYNEPMEIVERTLQHCERIRWPGGTRIYMLDDSTNDADKKNMDVLARQFGCKIVRRPNREGYKAGNINNAIATAVTEEYFVILDSDQAPQPDFLEETMDYFSDPQVCFVQTPQHFINDDTPLRRAAKVSTNIFYYSQCITKANDGAMPFCGTNAVIRTSVFHEVKGFSYYTSTEDIELGLRMNDAGYHGVYVPKILVHGYAPPDYPAYATQQYRWANGNLAILRESFTKVLSGNFSMRQQLHTIITLGWWFIGIVTLVYIFAPILAMLTGWGTHHTWLPTSLLMMLYLNVVIGIGMIYVSLHDRVDSDKITIKDALLQYSLITNSMFIYAKAAINAVFKRYIGFVTTNKKGTGSGWREIKWNLMFAGICFGFSMYALYQGSIASDMIRVRTYIPISVWLLFYSIILASSIIFVGDSKTVTTPTATRRKITA